MIPLTSPVAGACLVWLLLAMNLHNVQPQADTTELSRCGRTSLIGGLGTLDNKVQLGEHPHMCVLFTELKGSKIFVGGASLISPNLVLTLATGVDQFRENDNFCSGDQRLRRKLTVQCGDIHLQNKDSQEVAQVRDISRIIVHPDYNKRSLTHDFAVLEVSQPFTYSPTVGRVCLPKPEQRLDAYDDCAATGHGTEDVDYIFYSPKLSTVTLPLLDSSECEEMLNSEFFSEEGINNWKIDSSFLCTLGVNISGLVGDTCEGDGGGPLVCGQKRRQEGQGQGQEEAEDQDYLSGFSLRGDEDEEQEIVQIGVTAWGVKCGSTGLPSVFSNIIAERCWLDQVISCNPPSSTEVGADDDYEDYSVDLRQDDDDYEEDSDSPLSAGGLTESQCSGWLRSANARKSACGCIQRLAPDNDGSKSGVEGMVKQPVDNNKFPSEADYEDVRGEGGEGGPSEADYEDVRGKGESPLNNEIPSDANYEDVRGTGVEDVRDDEEEVDTDYSDYVDLRQDD